MATGNMTTTTVAAFIPEIWSKEVILSATNRMVMGKLVRTDFDGDIKQFGDTVHVPVFSTVTVGSKAANTAVTYTNYTESTKDISINKHKYFAFRVEDIAKIQASPDLLAGYAAQGGAGIAKQIDTDVGALITAGITQNVGTMNTSAWGDITDALLRSAIQKLDEAEAPEENRHLVITPAQKNALLGIDKFVEASKRGDGVNPIPTGLFGEIYGVTVWVSNNLPTVASVASSGGGAHVHDYKANILFQKEAFALCTQLMPRVQAVYDIDYLATSVVGDVLYGTGTLIPSFGCQIRTGS